MKASKAFFLLFAAATAFCGVVVVAGTTSAVKGGRMRAKCVGEKITTHLKAIAPKGKKALRRAFVQTAESVV